MKALVAIGASRDYCESEFVQHLATIIIPSGWQIVYGWLQHFSAAERHNVAVGESKFYDRLLFLDTDQLYPKDYYVKMLEHDEPVVSALNTAKYYPFDLCVFHIKDDQKVIDENGKETYIPVFEAMSSEKIMAVETDCFLCDMSGTGALMLNPTVLSEIGKPYFKDVYSQDGRRLLCDDFYFSYKLFKAGYKTLIDTRIVPGHIAKIIAKPYNAIDLKRAYEKTNSSFGYWKDGKDPSIVLK